MMTGWLFDLFAKGSEMILWFLADDGHRVRAVDRNFALEPYLDGPKRSVDACLRAIDRAKDAELLGWTDRRDFWTGRDRRVFALRVRSIETWRFKLQRYSNRYPLVSWYNADLLPEQVYCYERDIFPLARCSFETRDGVLTRLQCEDDRWATEYASPPLHTVEVSAEGTLLGRCPRLQSLTLADNGRSTTWDEPDFLLPSFQEAVESIDPDVILTREGDAFIMPLLLTIAHRMRFPLRLDREDPPQERRVQTDGRSFFSYGRILYQAPEYPLYGRWHLDRDNSFMVGHTGLEGLFEVTRLSRLPAQRIGRRSIGTGITSVQLDLAYHEGFLIPWKKTFPEAWKTASQLIRSDRGGLVYAPEIGLHEKVVELDFVSMYPTIMSRFNVSPETVNCSCCRDKDVDPAQRVPQIGYTICEKRHGLVSRALAPLIDKRIRYKTLRRASKETGDDLGYERFDQRQSAIKWMLVCCFGYLGYRNARFGRIEAHETVSAFSRELLTVAREVCEEHGWHMLHANVDCVWITKPGFEREEINELCRRIDNATGLTIALEGIYNWIAFLPSRQYADRPVPARFFGAFDDGELKIRGVEARRRDIPPFVKEAQLRLLNELRQATNKAEYEAMVPDLLKQIEEWEDQLWRQEVPLDRLAIRSALSQEPEEYTGNGMQAIAARQSSAAGLNLHAGQTLEYLIVDAQNEDRASRVRLAPLIDAETSYDPAAYIRLLRRAANALLWPVGVQLDEDRIPPPWESPAPGTKGKAKPSRDENAQLDFLADSIG